MGKTLTEKRVDEVKRSNHFEKWAFRLGLIIIIIASMVSFLFFKEVFFPKKILYIKSSVLPVAPETVTAGDKITFTVDYCKVKNLPSDIKVTFVDGQLIGSFNTTRNFPTGCHKQPVSVDVPISLKKDDYHLEIQISYAGGFINNEVHFLKTEPFNVVEPSKNPQTTIIEQCINSSTVPASTSFEPIQPSATTPAKSNQNISQPTSSNQQNTNNNTGGGNQNPPDNDGIIIDIPLLPPVHIPSPF